MEYLLKVHLKLMNFCYDISLTTTTTTTTTVVIIVVITIGSLVAGSEY
jgi:hypothetical protein